MSRRAKCPDRLVHGFDEAPRGGFGFPGDGLLDAGVPSSPVWDLAQAAGSEHARVRQLQFQPEGSVLPLVPQPVFFNGRKPHAITIAPRLGADNAAFGLNKAGEKA